MDNSATASHFNVISLQQLNLEPSCHGDSAIVLLDYLGVSVNCCCKFINKVINSVSFINVWQLTVG